jgi:hypothetical protein
LSTEKGVYLVADALPPMALAGELMGSCLLKKRLIDGVLNLGVLSALEGPQGANSWNYEIFLLDKVYRNR